MNHSIPTSRLSFLVLITLLLFSVTANAQVEGISITGESVKALRPFDILMTNFLKDHSVPGASVCIARNGRIIYARGFGLADRKIEKPVEPHSLFRIASVSKPITATAVMRLIQSRRLKLDDNPFVVLGYEDRLDDDDVDPRLKTITIEHLLHHTAGWDREKAFDPMFQYRRISKAMDVPSPPSHQAIIEFMIGQPLQSDPGTFYAYSNFGYCLLGRVIEKQSGLPYEQYVQEKILAPLKITSMRIGGSLPEDRADFEVRYYDANDATGSSVFEPGRIVPRPYVIDHEVMDSHGAWIASSTDLVKIAIALNTPDSRLLNRRSLQRMFSPPPGDPGHKPNGDVKDWFYGYGWSVRPVTDTTYNNWHMGRINGSSTLLVRRHDDLAWAVLFNCDRSAANGEPLALMIDPLMHRAARRVRKWPDR